MKLKKSILKELKFSVKITQQYKQMNKTLFFGPIMPPIHGQSLAFTRLYEKINHDDKLLIDTNIEGFSMSHKVFLTLKLLLKIFYCTFFHKYDVVYFTCSRTFLGSIRDVFLINASYLKGVKIVNHLHGSDFYDFLHSTSKWYYKILLSSYNKVDESIVLIEEMKDQFRDFKNMKVNVVHNFYDNEMDVEFKSNSTDTVNLLYLSNIIKSKGIFELLEAFDDLSKEYKYLYLNIAGEFMSDDLMSAEDVKDLFYEKISNNPRISYLGVVFGEGKIELLQKSDIFVLPSYYKSEAFPISILESMICRNAIVTTNYKYLTSIVKEKNGAIVKCKSITSLNSGLKKIISNSELMKSMQAENYKEAKAKYSFKIHLGKVAKILSL
jgi:glycosyltransferase involved in cell wall biosynthesis